MIKKLMIALIISTPYVCADWLDELVGLTENAQELDLTKASEVLEKYSAADTQEIAKLEKARDEKKEHGFWGSLRGGTYSVQITAAKSSLKYHQKVAQFIKELPENKRERQKFTQNLKDLRKLYHELTQLKADYAKADGFGQKIKAGALIAAKELQIRSRRAYLKSMFLL